MQQLLDFLNRLEEERLAYSLEHNTPDAIMVLVAVPGERWEIELFADGSVEVEVFTSGGVTEAGTLLDQLFERHGESPAA
ncbi:MAG: hypothetical protein AAF624_12665 [Bacteroidota bacterium]